MLVACVMAKKKEGSSWLAKVKSAFRSPNKQSPEKKNKNRKCVEHDHDQDEEDKKRERRRWIFRKSVIKDHETAAASSGGCDALKSDQKDAIAIDAAAATTAEAAVATVHAAVEVDCPPTYNARGDCAAIVIQTAFRRYLARRALHALKGLVKLQALVRGHNVRRQAKLTLQCMQALVRVQTQVLDQRSRLSNEDFKRKFAFSDTASQCESRCFPDTLDKISMPKEGSSIADDWDERPHTIEEIKTMLQKRKEDSAFRHEKKLSQVFSQQQTMRSGRRPLIQNEEELHICPRLDQWRAAAKTPFNSRRSSSFKARTSTDNRESIKTIEINAITPLQTCITPNSNRKVNEQIQRPSSPLHKLNSPLRRTSQNGPIHHMPATPSPARTGPIQVRATTSDHTREDRTYTSPQTPSLRSNYQYTGYLRNQQVRFSGLNATTTLPNYMAATESMKARLRSQSAPRPRRSTPERDRYGSAKKRLSFPIPESCSSYGQGSMRSPSFKSVSCSHYGGLEQQSNYSCCTESLGGEISPTSSSDLRRSLR